MTETRYWIIAVVTSLMFSGLGYLFEKEPGLIIGLFPFVLGLFMGIIDRGHT